MKTGAVLRVGLATLFSLLITVGSTVAASAAPSKPVKQVDLSAPYQQFLPKEKNQNKVIHHPRGHQPTGGSGTAACSEPACPLPYNGGSVQHNPKVYLLLWGSSWSDTGSDTSYLQNFISGLGVQPNDKWSTSMVQYTDSTGHPSFTGSVYQGTWKDVSNPPFGVTQTQLGAEADAFYSSQGITDRINAEIVIATPSGTCPEGFYSPTCSGGSGQYCAWHSYSSSASVPYTNLPYLPDSGTGCGQGSVNSPGTYDGFSIVEGHEYGETVTDPFPNSGWRDLNDASGGENGDKCSWTNLANVAFSTGSFAMQPLWSNSANACVMSTQIWPLTVLKSGTGAGTVTSSPGPINCGATCSASYSNGTTVTLTEAPASGSTFGGWSGACSGTSSTCTVSMTAAKSVTATFNGGSPPPRVEESAATFDGWAPDATATYRASKVTGNTAQFPFTGTSVKWLTKKGPTFGKASVTIDGVAKGTFDLYASTVQSSTLSFTGLASSAHKIVIKVLGTKNASATDYNVAVDGFTVGTTTTQENSVKVLYDTWKGVTSTTASGGTYRVAKAAGKTASFPFTGTGVDWITYTGPGWGMASVTIDGVSKGTVDLYAATTHAQTAKTFGGLASGSHTITIKVLGTKNAAASSTAVPVDAFAVH